MYTDKISILLVESDPVERQYLESIFRTVKVPHGLSICESSQQLAEHLRYTQELPHLILLSANLPDISKLGYFKKLRESIKPHSCTLGVYSKETATDGIRDLFASGLNIYIEKPADPSLLDKIIKEVVSVNWQYMTDGLDRERFILKY